jgi:hypothetical protein
VKFALLLGEDVRLAARAEDEQRRLVDGHRAVIEDLRARGQLVDAFRLRPASEAATVRGPDRVVVDGPFAEAKECIGGLYLIECASMEDAVGWARRLPPVEGGTIEVRPARTGALWRRAVRGAHRFVVLFVSSEASLLRRTRAEIHHTVDTHYELALELAARGQFVSSRALERGAPTVRIRRTDGAEILSDGPYAETKETIGGYMVVACDTKAEAVELARRLIGNDDAAEVRPVWDA